MNPVSFGISTGPQGIEWQVLRDIWKVADDIDLFETGWVNDHFFGFKDVMSGPPFIGDPDQGAADGWMVLASLLVFVDDISSADPKIFADISPPIIGAPKGPFSY